MEIENRIENLRDGILDLFDKFEGFCGKHDLPRVPSALRLSVERLKENSYQIMVGGHVKRGKSSFINSIIGRWRFRVTSLALELLQDKSVPDAICEKLKGLSDTLYENLDEFSEALSNVLDEEERRTYEITVAIACAVGILPTGDEIATCRIFQVRHAETEQYRLRYEDESEKPISFDELRRYGSQMNVEDAAPSSQRIKWIEVEVPFAFLPENVLLLDTPGTGGVYSMHDRITHRYLPLVDGAIEVFDTKSPVSEIEFGVLEDLCAHTKHLFFILSKIDQVGPEEWNSLRERNEKQLSKRLGDQLGVIRVLPFSGVLLCEAQIAADDDDLFRSKYPEVESRLRSFLFLASGFRQSAEALSQLGMHLRTCARLLQQQIESCVDDTNKTRDAYTEEIEQQQAKLYKRWSKNGADREAAIKALEEKLNSAEERMTNVLGDEGKIARDLKKEIDNVGTLEDANKLGQELGENAASKARDQWSKVQKQVYACLVTQLGLFLQKTQSYDPDEAGVNIEDANFTDVDSPDFWAKVESGSFLAFISSSAVGIPTGIMVAAGLIAGPVATLGVAAFALLNFFGGWRKPARAKVNEARNKLREHLLTVLESLRDSFLQVNEALSESAVDKYLNEVRRTFTTQIDTVVDTKQDEAEQQIEKLRADAQLDVEQRVQRKNELDEQLGTIQSMQQAASRCLSELTDIESVLTSLDSPDRGNAGGHE